MSRTTMVVGLLACVTLTAGCSGSGSDKGATTPITQSAKTSVTAEPTEPSSALEGMSAEEVWTKVKADVADVTSVHVAAKMEDGKDSIRLNLKLSNNGKAFGTMTVNGDTMTVRRLGKVLYFKAEKDFWIKNADADAAGAKSMAARWFRATKGASKDMAEFFEFTDVNLLLKESMKMTAAERESLERVPGITIGGQKTVGLTVETEELDLLYVADADPALPLNMTMSTDKKQYMKFRSWNKDFSVQAPKGAFDLDPAS